MSEQESALKDVPAQYLQLIRVIGFEATLRLCEAFGGDSPYIPKVDRLLAIRRNEAIRAEYNGTNIAKLARKYHLTTRSIQLILKGCKPPQVKGQMSIEDFLMR